MSPAAVVAVIGAYFTLLLLLSRFAVRKGAGADNSTFFTGGRRTPWPLVAIAMIGASISGVTFISVPGMVATKGYTYLQMALGFTVGYAVIAAVLLPLFYKRRLSSIYGYLRERFGAMTHRSGAWLFFICKLTGAGVRFFVVCVVLQELVFDPLHIPFVVNVAVSVALTGLYTVSGGVRTLIVTDLLKSLCLVGSVVLCIALLARELGLGAGALVSAVAEHSTARVFEFADPRSGLYFWKQFIAGVFLSIACNGLDQDLMQRNLACRGAGQAQKNLISAALMQLGVIALFLVLGTLLVMYVESRTDMTMPGRTDTLFSYVVTDGALPPVLGVIFIIGLISAAYSAAGSAITSMTTSFTVDILRRDPATEEPQALRRTRVWVHAAMTAAMAATVIAIYYLVEEDAISAVYTIASYTYGPILGLFALGLFSGRRVADRLVPVACIAAPLLSWALQWWLREQWGYVLGFELLLVNAFFTAAIASIPLRANQTAPRSVEEV